MAEGAKDMPIFTFGMWSQILYCLDPAPIHKIKIRPSESEPGGYKKIRKWQLPQI
jgi:hypothetical protein